MQAYFGRAKAACLCSYRCNRNLCYDGGRLVRVKIVTRPISSPLSSFNMRFREQNIRAPEENASISGCIDVLVNLALSKDTLLRYWFEIHFYIFRGFSAAFWIAVIISLAVLLRKPRVPFLIYFSRYLFSVLQFGNFLIKTIFFNFLLCSLPVASLPLPVNSLM